MLFHNHPSGDPKPSDDDVALTRRLVAAGVLMGIDVLDHVILADVRYYSFRETGIVLELAKTLYFDCFSGASGDMILGALLDLGLPLEALRGALGSLAIEYGDGHGRARVARRRLGDEVQAHREAAPDAARPARRTRMRTRPRHHHSSIVDGHPAHRRCRSALIDARR